MYVNLTARSLGEMHPMPPVQAPKHCGRRWKAYHASHPKAEHGWADFLKANPDCHGGKHHPLPPVPLPMPPVLLSGLGTTAACADAGTGLLVDCWKAAEQKGLGYSLDQAQLAKVATAYQRMTRPNSLAGWVFTGNKMVWRGGALGDELLDPNVTPPDPLTISQYAKKPPSLPASVWNIQPVFPAVTAQTLLAAAQLPNAPGIVKQAAAQLAPDMGWFTQQMISGVPNYLLVGAGVLVLVLVSKGRRR